MEQDDLEEFKFWTDDTGGYGYLDCLHCANRETIKRYDTALRCSINLLELMEDAAAHFAQVHRKSNDPN